jgi:hypothetical protein
MPWLSCGYLTVDSIEVSVTHVLFLTACSASYGSLISYHAVGVLYAALAGFLFLAAFFRARHSRHDFADRHKEVIPSRPLVIKTKGQEGARIFGRPFVTAGWIVVAVSAIVAVVEICLLVLIFYL